MQTIPESIYHFRLFFLILLSSLTAGGCGGNGTVPAMGKVTIEGESASAGRIMFVPVDEGIKADSIVMEEGAFALQTKGDLGALPGKYKVIFRTDVVDEKLSKKTPKGNRLPPDAVIIYQSPAADPLTIPEAGSEELAVEINKKYGWTRVLSD